MKIVAIACVQDEADIIDATARHLFDQGITSMILTDHRSTDATPAILQELSRVYSGRVELLRDDRLLYHAAEIAAVAAERANARGADWILPFDADEFWIPVAHATLREAFESAAADADTIVAERYWHRTWQDRFIAPHGSSKIAIRGGQGRLLQRGYHQTDPPGQCCVRGIMQVREVPFRSEDHFHKKMRARIETMQPDSRNMEYIECRTPRGAQSSWRRFTEASCIADPIPSERRIEIQFDPLPAPIGSEPSHNSLLGFFPPRARE